MSVTLDPVEIRALGALIEKQITTPDYYPLTLNALVNACNQTTNRDPVTTYGEGAVAGALDHLREKELVFTISNSRVPKYGHRFKDRFHLAEPEVAAMCVLLLRGPQTAGEVRSRSGRLHAFASLEEVDQAFAALAGAEPPMVTKLPRLPGTKEPRFAHLLGGELSGTIHEASPAREPAAAEAFDAGQERIARIEGEVEALRQNLEELRAQFLDLKHQLE